MRTTISTAGNRSLNASSTDAVWLAMVKLAHRSWSEKVRLVANTQEITHMGEVYNPFPFTISLPDEEQESNSVIQWAAANASQELLVLFKQVVGPISGEVFWVLAETPDHIEIGPFNLELRAFEYDASTISGTLVVEPVLDAVFGVRTMDTKNAPGLF